MACARIFLEARKAAFHWDPRDYQLDEFDSSTKGETLWVAEGGSRCRCVVAFASVWCEPGYWYLHNLFVAPGYQRVGVGRGLLHHVLGEIGRPVELKTDCANLAARSLYKSSGFRDAEEGRNGEVSWIRMRLEASAAAP